MRHRIRDWFKWKLFRHRNKQGECGCGSTINEYGYCHKYWGSDEFGENVMGESMRRHGGLGFGTQYTAEEAMMSMHRQQFGATSEEFEALLHKRPVHSV